jgi:hypothetical protein
MIEPFGFIAAGSAASKYLHPHRGVNLGANSGAKTTQARCFNIADACVVIAPQVFSVVNA